MAGQKPRQGWIYLVNPYLVSLHCRAGHVHIYDLKESGEFIECKHVSCSLKINSSRVIRGFHPYIVWTSDQFQSYSGDIKTFTLIPLSSKETYKGLPTTYPINPTQSNGLSPQSYALVHKIFTVDANCFKDSWHDWLKRLGQLEKSNKEAIEQRLKHFLTIQDNPSDDWFTCNVSPELARKVFYHLSEDEKNAIMEEFF